MSPEMLRMCTLIRDGRAACATGKFDEAERLFIELKRSAPDDAAETVRACTWQQFTDCSTSPVLHPNTRQQMKGLSKG